MTLIKKIVVLFLLLVSVSAQAQDNIFQRYLKSKQEAYQQSVNSMKQDYQDYVAKQNAEFAEFVAAKWQLFEEFGKSAVALSKPKIDVVPVAVADENEVRSADISYSEDAELPSVTHCVAVAYDRSGNGSYEIKSRIAENGVVEVPSKASDSPKETEIEDGTLLKINFYGREVPISVDPKLRITSKNVEEKSVADYFSRIAACRNETGALWNEITGAVEGFGLNEWGYFCLLRSVSEKMFANIDDRVLFCFYMLRNEGGFKARVARGKDSGKLTLLVALDNSKEVYSYTFFRFDDAEDGTSKVKYYMVYGGGTAKEPVYTYDFCKQDSEKRQMGLDFAANLNMGSCDTVRTLNLTPDRTVTLPYNSAHVAYLNDVPMTVFPIYFMSPLSIEAQRVLQESFNEMRAQYTPTQFIQILLHFVQTAFDYKTDEDQFGYEKYFYPEEVICYPYSDCEDRAALFAWLVQKYTDAKVIGLQYEGHIATAVWFGDNAEAKGDSFMYGGKRYFVCDPTYINATIGMTMPKYEGVTPKVIKIKR